MYVCVNSGAGIWYSPDYVNWTQAFSTGGTWQAVAFGAGNFLAVSQSGVFASSPDGINWTFPTPPNTGEWFSVVYGANKGFAAVSYTSQSLDRTAFSATGTGASQTVLTLTDSTNLSQFAAGTAVNQNSAGQPVTSAITAATPPSNGIGQTYESGGFIYSPLIAVDSVGNRVIAMYRPDPSTTAQIVVGTVSGSSITYGTPVTVPVNGAVNSFPTALFFDEDTQRVVVATNNDSTGGGSASTNEAVIHVGSLSGNTITFGSATSLGLGSSQSVATMTSIGGGVLGLFYSKTAAGWVDGMVVGGKITASSNSFTVGTPLGPVNNSGQTMYFQDSAYDPASGVILAIEQDNSSGQNKCRASTYAIDSTTLAVTAKSARQYASTGAINTNAQVSYNPVDSGFVIAFSDAADTDRGKMRYASVSPDGALISFGSIEIFDLAKSYTQSSNYVPSLGSVVITYRDETYQVFAVPTSLSGTTLSAGADTQIIANIIDTAPAAVNPVTSDLFTNYTTYSAPTGTGAVIKATLGVTLTLTDNTNLANFRAGDAVTETGGGGDGTGLVGSVGTTSMVLTETTGTWNPTATVTGPFVNAASGTVGSTSGSTMTLSSATGRFLVTESGYETAKKLNKTVTDSNLPAAALALQQLSHLPRRLTPQWSMSLQTRPTRWLIL